MRRLTPTEKGGIAELAIASAAARLGIVVSRPMVEGRRYDLIFDVSGRLLRVQCKRAPLSADVICVKTRTSRRSASGHVRGTYSAADIDAIAA